MYMQPKAISLRRECSTPTIFFMYASNSSNNYYIVNAQKYPNDNFSSNHKLTINYYFHPIIQWKKYKSAKGFLIKIKPNQSANIIFRWNKIHFWLKIDYFAGYCQNAINIANHFYYNYNFQVKKMEKNCYLLVMF